MHRTDASSFELAPRRARRLDFAQGRELVVLQGRVWLTCSDQGEDIFVSAGHSARVGAGAVIECDSAEGARMRLVPAQESWLALAGRALSAFGALMPRLPVLRPAPPDRQTVDGCKG
jgi:hypothetical protein